MATKKPTLLTSKQWGALYEVFNDQFEETEYSLLFEKYTEKEVRGLIKLKLLKEKLLHNDTVLVLAITQKGRNTVLNSEWK